MNFPLFGILGQQVAGAPASQYPVVENVTATPFASNTTAHAVSMPASVTAGNLLLMIWSSDGTATTTTPSTPGTWDSKYNVSSLARSNCYARVASGTEGGTTVNVQTSAIEAGSAQVYQISNWGGSTTDVEVATATGGTGTTRTCPTLTPTWGSGKNLWIVALHGSEAQTVTTLPTNFTNLISTIGTSGTAGGQTFSGRREFEGTSLAPGNFTLSATTTSSFTMATIAVKVASGGAGPQEYTLWATAVPGNLDSSPTSTTCGTKFRVSRDGVIRGIRWYRTSGNSGVSEVALFQGTTNISGTRTVSGETASGWQRMDFAAPVSISANTIYIAAAKYTTGKYRVLANLFTNAITNGPLESITIAESQNGVYAENAAMTAPTLHFQGEGYFIDPVFYG